MKDFTSRPIAECVRKVSQIAPSGNSNGRFLYVDLSSIDKDEKQIIGESVQRLSWEDAPSRARQIVQTGDILVSTVRPNLNGVAQLDANYDGAIASTGFCVLRTNSDVLDSRYLFHWLCSQKFVAEMVKLATGASYPAVSDRIIHESLIPLPYDVIEQRRIAAILDKANTISNKRAAVLLDAGNYLHSVFFDLFGDPVSNSKGLPELPLAELAKVTTGNTPSRVIDAYFGNHIEWIKSDNLNTPFHFLTKATEGLSEAGLRVARSVPAGSTLITCIAGSSSCIGNAALADRKVSFNQQINALTPKPGIEPEFIYAATLFSKPRIQAASTNGMKGMVSKGALEQVRFILPSQDQREKFAGIFRKVMALTEKLERSASEANTLYGSLSQRAFQGKL